MQTLFTDSSTLKNNPAAKSAFSKVVNTIELILPEGINNLFDGLAVVFWGPASGIAAGTMAWNEASGADPGTRLLLTIGSAIATPVIGFFGMLIAGHIHEMASDQHYNPDLPCPINSGNTLGGYGFLAAAAVCLGLIAAAPAAISTNSHDANHLKQPQITLQHTDKTKKIALT